jgi:hypothetical protein
LFTHFELLFLGQFNIDRFKRGSNKDGDKLATFETNKIPFFVKELCNLATFDWKDKNSHFLIQFEVCHKIFSPEMVLFCNSL